MSAKPQYTMDMLLDAVPMPNERVREERRGEKVLLWIPLKKRWFMGPPFSWILPFRSERAVVIDPLGQEVWERCDGRRQVEQIIDEFASSHRLRFHEARLSVELFLKQLTQRGAIAMVGLNQGDDT